MTTYKTEMKFSKSEMVAFRSLIQSIHPDKHPEISEEDRALLGWATSLANHAKEANQWRPIELMVNSLANGMESFVTYIKTLKDTSDKPKEEKPSIKIDPLKMAKAGAFRDANVSWVGRGTMSDWMRNNLGLSPAEAKAYCDMLFVKEGKATASGYAADFYSKLKDGPMNNEAFEQWIKAGSQNVMRHKTHYNGIREMANAIWAKK